MTQNSIKALFSGTDTKAALTDLKKELKDDKHKITDPQKDRVPELLDRLIALLDDTDPKIRKNSTACLGYLGQMSLKDDTESNDRIVGALYNAYCSEQTKYNMAAYIEALGRLDFSSVNEKLLERRQELCRGEYAVEEKKHIIEEMRELNGILRDNIEKKHEFTGFDLVNEASLLTNRNFKSITIEELGRIPHKEFNAGVMVKTKNIRKASECRTFSEMLFVPGILNSVAENPDNPDHNSKDKPHQVTNKEQVPMNEPAGYATELIKAGLVEYLAARHSNPDAPFYFRVELKCRDEKKKAGLEKKIAAEFEYASGWRLINSTSDYDLEFRFVESSTGKLNFLIGMRTFPDERFAYRKQTLSTGMKPSLAALLVRLSKDYIRENAAVLDPVCGTGVFLVEREMYKPARLLYGIDIFGEAVKAAKENIAAAGISRKCELINRDFLEFRHQYRFDEIYADMPRITAGKDSESVERFYMGFLKHCVELLEKDGHLFVFTHNRNILKRYLSKYGYSVLEELEISKMEEAYYYIMRHDD